MDGKKFGELCEIEFAVEAMRLGLIVSKPFGEVKYDLIIDNGKKRLRIQIKSTRTLSCKTKKSQFYSVNISSGSYGQTLYNKKQIDFFAIYVAPEKTWYIIPVCFLNVGKISLAPSSENSKYDQFREAWHLIQ